MKLFFCLDMSTL